MNDKTDMRLFTTDERGKAYFNLDLLKKGMIIHAKDNGKNYPFDEDVKILSIKPYLMWVEYHDKNNVAIRRSIRPFQIIKQRKFEVTVKGVVYKKDTLIKGF
ncbi:protein of unknown function [Ruminococcaceae bacterium BL-6]|nr:protein of unknown function [Ruminococcaceae bacterium BL-6]